MLWEYFRITTSRLSCPKQEIFSSLHWEDLVGLLEVKLSKERPFKTMYHWSNFLLSYLFTLSLEKSINYSLGFPTLEKE